MAHHFTVEHPQRSLSTISALPPAPNTSGPAMIPTRFVLTLSDCIRSHHLMRGRSMRGTCLQTGRREHKIPGNSGCPGIFRQGARKYYKKKIKAVGNRGKARDGGDAWFSGRRCSSCIGMSGHGTIAPDEAAGRRTHGHPDRYPIETEYTLQRI